MMAADMKVVDIIKGIRNRLDKHGLDMCDFRIDVKPTAPGSVNVIVKVCYNKFLSTTHHLIITSITAERSYRKIQYYFMCRVEFSFQKVLDHVDAWAEFMSMNNELLKNGSYRKIEKKESKLCLN